MFLSLLKIDMGNNPGGPQPGRLWLRNVYRVHQRLCMAFPSPSRLLNDADFHEPFKPEDFGGEQVHVPRGADAGFLFRIDPQPAGRAVILVQSATKPDWDHAFHNADYLLAAPPVAKPFDPTFENGQQFRFRLVANPTKKIDTKSGPDGSKRNGKRVSVPDNELSGWLTKRSEKAGLAVDEDSLTVQPSYIYVNKNGNGKGQQLRSARYEGVLKVTGHIFFREALFRGIGPGKAYGFGLLSLARM